MPVLAFTNPGQERSKQVHWAARVADLEAAQRGGEFDGPLFFRALFSDGAQQDEPVTRPGHGDVEQAQLFGQQPQPLAAPGSEQLERRIFFGPRRVDDRRTKPQLVVHDKPGSG